MPKAEEFDEGALLAIVCPNGKTVRENLEVESKAEDRVEVISPLDVVCPNGKRVCDNIGTYVAGVMEAVSELVERRRKQAVHKALDDWLEQINPGKKSGA